MARESRRDRDDEYEDEDRPRRRRDRDADDRYDDGDGSSRRGGPAKAKGLNVCGLIALILGVIGLPLSIFGCTAVVGIPLAAIGLLLGIIGLFTGRQTTGRGMPIAGTCVSLAGVLVGVGWLILGTYVFKKGQEAHEQIKADMDKWQKEAEERRKQEEAKKKEEEKELREGKAVTVTAVQLYKDFDENPLSADTKYKNKVVEVTGEVARVEKAGFRQAIELQTEGNGIVRCEFEHTADVEAQLEKVKVRQQVTIRGRCTGSQKGDSVKVEKSLLVARGGKDKKAP